MSGVKVAGVWKTPSTVSVKVGGVWRTASTVSVRVGGVWKVSTFGGAPPPVLTYVSTGVFEVSNTTGGVYTPTLLTGSGTATQSTVGGKIRFTLSAATARFSVTFAYAAGAPQSTNAFVERKAYSYTCRQQGYGCTYGCNCVTTTTNCYCAAPSGGGCPAGTSPNGQCGCGGGTPCMGGTIGGTTCQTCSGTCYTTICDVLVNEPGYVNSGTEWYKVV